MRDRQTGDRVGGDWLCPTRMTERVQLISEAFLTAYQSIDDDKNKRVGLHKNAHICTNR